MDSVAEAISLEELRKISLFSPADDVVPEITEDEDHVKPSCLEQEQETCSCCTWSTRARAYKNLIGAGLSFLFVFSSIISLYSIQSSLNDAEGLGLATLAITNGVFLLSGLFVPTIIDILGTKYTAVFSISLITVYSLTNFYPQWYTLVPGSICAGIGLGPLFAALNVHVTTTARHSARELKENPNYMVTLFTGIHTMFFKLSYIPGNLATTIILFSGELALGEGGIVMPLGSVCNNTEAGDINPSYVYSLIAVFVLLDILSLILCLSFIDHFGTDTRLVAMKHYIKEPIKSTFEIFTHWKIYMLIPMMILDGFLTSFVIGHFVKKYVSDCIGVHWIGLVAMTYGVCSGLSAVVGGRLTKCIPQFIIVYTFSLIMLATVLFLIFWEKEPSYVIAFVPTAIFGLCEGTWHSVPPSLVGIIFQDNQEAAYSTIRMGLAGGYLLGFLLALFFKTYILLSVGFCIVLISTTTYSILVFKTETKEQLLPCCFKEKESNEPKENGDIRKDDTKSEEFAMTQIVATSEDTLANGKEYKED